MTYSNENCKFHILEIAMYVFFIETKCWVNWAWWFGMVWHCTRKEISAVECSSLVVFILALPVWSNLDVICSELCLSCHYCVMKCMFSVWRILGKVNSNEYMSALWAKNGNNIYVYCSGRHPIIVITGTWTTGVICPQHSYTCTCL